ncbi:MAG: hypothetical protein QM820_24105 [Minicystis sp.]
MATLQSGNSPGQRLERGDSVLAAAASVSIKPIQKRFGAFKKIHAAYGAADRKVKGANDAVTVQQQKVAEADVDQDAAVQDLAGGLAGDGLPRVNPFQAFGAPPPAALCKMGYGSEAEAVLALEKAVLKRKGLSAGSRTKAKKAGAAAKKVLAAIKPIANLEKARTNARSAREALEQGWETEFAALKRAARAAEDDGAKGLFAALFERAPKPASKKANGKKSSGKEANGKEANGKKAGGKEASGKETSGNETDGKGTNDELQPE